MNMKYGKRIEGGQMIKLIAQFKVYAVRSQQYAGIIMIFIQVSMFLVINAQIDLIWWQYILVFLLSAAAFVFVGFLDVKFRVLSEEQKFYGDKNPIFNEFFEQLNTINEKLDNL